ncbi:MAG: tRNA lysidine(34) synthetase TilS, partial [Longimicrobiales bacterium]
PPAPAALHARMRSEAARLLADRSRVLVALSGGLDSVVLLHLLRFDLACDVVAAHFDHAMRPSSGTDALWVRGLCTAWNVPLHAARAEDRPASEAAARELRYGFLLAAADRAGADAVVTAHHADDQAETVLFRLARGTGLAGLAGIPVRRGIIVRPLLAFARADLHAYARAHRICWREDPSNRSLRFARNRIRHRVLPELERARPGAAQRIARIAQAAAAAERAWRGIVDAAIEDVVEHADADGFVLARERLLVYDPHVRARVMRHLLGRLGSRPDRAGTRSAMSFISAGVSGVGVELTGGIRLEREFDRLKLRAARAEPLQPDVSLRIADTGPGAGTFVAGGQKYAARWAPAGHSAPAGHAARFDPSSLRFPLELRAWHAGDRIRLAYGSKKLKRLFQERRIGRSRRAAVPVLIDGTGTVLWAVGVARSADAHTAGTAAVLEITVTDGDTQ